VPQVMRSQPPVVKRVWERLQRSLIQRDSVEFIHICDQNLKTSTLNDILSSIRKRQNLLLERNGRSKSWIQQVELLFQMLDVDKNFMLSPDEMLFFTPLISKTDSWGQLLKMSRVIMDDIWKKHLKSNVSVSEISLTYFKRYLLDEPEARIRECRVKCIRNMQSWYSRYCKEGKRLWMQALDLSMMTTEQQVPPSLSKVIRLALLRKEYDLARHCARATTKGQLRKATMGLFREICEEINYPDQYEQVVALGIAKDPKDLSKDPLLRVVFRAVQTHTTLGRTMENLLKHGSTEGAGATARISISQTKESQSFLSSPAVLSFLTLKDWEQMMLDAKWKRFDPDPGALQRLAMEKERSLEAFREHKRQLSINAQTREQLDKGDGDSSSPFGRLENKHMADSLAETGGDAAASSSIKNRTFDASPSSVSGSSPSTAGKLSSTRAAADRSEEKARSENRELPQGSSNDDNSNRRNCNGLPARKTGFFANESERIVLRL